MRKLILIVATCLALMLSGVAQAQNIVIVTERNEYPYENFLREIYGPNVNITKGTYRNLHTNASQMARLEGADLIIVSRSPGSSNYDDGGGAEVAAWNALTTPMIVHSAFFARSASAQMALLEGDTVGVPPFDTINVTTAADPVFAGVNTSAGTVKIFETPEEPAVFPPTGGRGDNTLDIVTAATAGNGTVIAVPSTHASPLIARWNTGVETFTGSTQICGGPRMWFGTSEFHETPINYTADGRTILKNALYSLLAASTGAELLVTPLEGYVDFGAMEAGQGLTTRTVTVRNAGAPGSVINVSDVSIASGNFTVENIVGHKRPVIFPKGSTWKYLDDGSDQGTAWRAFYFDDASWKSGPGEFGYGGNDEATVLEYGGDVDNKYTTSYFRRSFNIADPTAFETVEITLIIDDGAVIYLNGTELRRIKMPEGVIFNTTYATGGAQAWTLSILSERFLAGTNVLAVEVHQNAANGGALGFDIGLTGVTAKSALTAPFTLSADDGDIIEATVGYDAQSPADDSGGILRVSSDVGNEDVTLNAKIGLFNVIYVTDGAGATEYPAYLETLYGAINVNVTVGNFRGLNGNAGMLAQLEAADLIIVSRNTSSGSYDDGNEKALWNNLSTPILNHCAYLSRANRWDWFDVDRQDRTVDNVVVEAPTDVIFSGIDVNSGSVNMWTPGDPGVDVHNAADAGSGIKVASFDNRIVIARWEASETPYHAASNYSPGGPRIFFATESNFMTNTNEVFSADGYKMLANAIRSLLFAKAEVESDVESVRFGTREVGSVTAATITVQNRGTWGSILNVSNVTITGDASFTYEIKKNGVVSGFPIALDRSLADVLEITVSYAPTAQGIGTATVSILSDDLVTAALDVALDGVAVVSGANTEGSKLDPADFASLGSLSVASGSVVIDTDAVTVTYGGNTLTGVLSVSQSGLTPIAAFCFDDIALTATADVTITGGFPLALLSKTSADIGVLLDVSGGDGLMTLTHEATTNTQPAAIGVAGGFDGTVARTAPNALLNGPGYGRWANNNNGGGGGAGYGGTGGRGGVSTTTNGGPGGPVYGDTPLTELLGGSGGAAGRRPNNNGYANTGGGAGGGAIEIAATGILTISSGGTISALGGNGGDQPNQPNPVSAAGGGGSGGSVLLSGSSVINNGRLEVYGGRGGDIDGLAITENTRRRCGGGGAGGRVAIYFDDDVAGGDIVVLGNRGGTPIPAFASFADTTIIPVDGVTAPGAAGDKGTIFLGASIDLVIEDDKTVAIGDGPLATVPLFATAYTPIGYLDFEWTVVGDATNVTLNPATINSLDAMAEITEIGAYEFKLTAAIEDLGLSIDDTIVVNVVNDVPVVTTTATPDSVLSPALTTSLSGVATDAYPSTRPLSLEWTVVSGPAVVSLATTDTVSTDATFTVPGRYTFQFTASDGEESASDQITVDVVGAGVLQPTVTAGADQDYPWTNVALLTLDGTLAGNPSTNIVTGKWTIESGPAGGAASFASDSDPKTKVAFTAPGNYLLRLNGDDGISQKSDFVTITANDAPVVNVGGDRSIRWPTNTQTFVGTATDLAPRAGVLTTTWSKVSGFGNVDFGNTVNDLVTTAVFSGGGTYVIRLEAQDALGLVGSDELTVSLVQDPAAVQSWLLYE